MIETVYEKNKRFIDANRKLRQEVDELKQKVYDLRKNYEDLEAFLLVQENRNGQT